MNRIFQQLDDARREAIARDLASKAAKFMERREYAKARKSYRAMCEVLAARSPEQVARMERRAGLTR